MYSVSPAAAGLWRRLLRALIDRSEMQIEVIDHPAPEPMERLWERRDLGAVFMCGLPFSRAQPAPQIVAAPIPSPPEFGGEPVYWSEFVVRADSGHHSVADTFGTRIAFTVPDSQSGCIAALSYFFSDDAASAARASAGDRLFAEIVAPTVTPLGALTAVVDGAADVAPIDAYALRLLQKYRPELTSQVRIVGRTAPTPIPPLVASVGVDALCAAFLDAHRHPATLRLMDALLLQRFARPDPDAYEALRGRFDTVVRQGGAGRLAAAVHPAFSA